MGGGDSLCNGRLQFSRFNCLFWLHACACWFRHFGLAAIYFCILDSMQGTLRSCSKAKVEAPMPAIEQVRFFVITTAHPLGDRRFLCTPNPESFHTPLSATPLSPSVRLEPMSKHCRLRTTTASLQARAKREHTLLLPFQANQAID